MRAPPRKMTPGVFLALIPPAVLAVLSVLVVDGGDKQPVLIILLSVTGVPYALGSLIAWRMGLSLPRAGLVGLLAGIAGFVGLLLLLGPT